MSINPQLTRGQTGTRAINDALLDAVTLDGFTVAGLPPAADHAGQLVHVTNGATGQPCLAFSNGAAWLRIVLGAAVAAS